MNEQSQCKLTVDLVCYNNTYPWKHICINRGTTSILFYVLMFWWLWKCYCYHYTIVLQVILKLFMILCICLLLIYPNFIIEGISTVYKLSTEAGECLNEHLLRKSKCFMNMGFLVYNFPKIASNPFIHKICGPAWTIEWYKPFLSSPYLDKVISWS